ncbi:MAG TPA: lactate utilization protein [Acidobacteriota bacterium]|nr:lactate utilization protein [Acidobacteriota bacterium]
MSRERILNRLRQALEKAQAPDLPTLPQPSGAVEGDISEWFVRQLRAADGEVYRAEDGAAVLEALGRIFSSRHKDEPAVEEAAWEELEVLEEHNIPYRCRRPSPEEPDEGPSGGGFWISRHPQGRVEAPLQLEWRSPHRQQAAQVPLSVSSGRWGIAETGSVYYQAGPGRSRLLSVLPPHHVVLLSRRRLLADAESFFQRLEAGREGSAGVLVTGPSRTADIEKELVVGVHGPKRLSVILTG